MSANEETRPRTSAASVAATTAVTFRSAARRALSLLRTIASWLSARISFAASRTARAAGASTSK